MVYFVGINVGFSQSNIQSFFASDELKIPEKTFRASFFPKLLCTRITAVYFMTF